MQVMVETYCAKCRLLGGGDKMSGKDSIRYIVEREFLSKLSTEELIARIVKKHIENAVKEIKVVEKKEKNL